MADGDKKGQQLDFGQFAHTDGNPQTVCSITLPSSVDGIYFVKGELTASTNTGTNDVVGTIQAQVRVDAGSATKMVEQKSENMQSTGYTLALDTSGAAVRLRFTAANGVRSVGWLKAFGVEMALTIG